MEYQKCVEQLLFCFQELKSTNTVAEELSQLIQHKINEIESKKKKLEFDDKELFLRDSSLIKIMYAETDGIKKFSFFYWNFPYLRLAFQDVTHDYDKNVKLEVPMLGVAIQQANVTDLKTYNYEILTMKLCFLYIGLKFIRSMYNDDTNIVIMPPEQEIEGIVADPTDIVYYGEQRLRYRSPKTLGDVLKKINIDTNACFRALNSLYPQRKTASTIFETSAGSPSNQQIKKETEEFLKTEQVKYYYLRLNSLSILNNDIQYWL